MDRATGLPTRIVHEASGIVLILIPAGEFQMGSPETEAGRGKGERQHRRLIRKPFYLGETEVTAGQFRKFVEATGYQTDAERGTPDNDHGLGAFSATLDGHRTWTPTASWRNPFHRFADFRLRDEHPVVQVSWNDAQKFVTHFGLGLPSEAQWEYAYRAGSKTRFPWGESEAGAEGQGNVADAAALKQFPAWNGRFTFDDGAALIAPVRQHKANAWKLYDMTGNVQEWCQDAYKKYPDDGADEAPVAGDGAAPRMMRGSSWLDLPDASRPAARYGMMPTSRRDFMGFRVARMIDQK